MSNKASRFHLAEPAVQLRNVLAHLEPMNMLYVGIDPGLSGAIAFLPSLRTFDPFVVDIPTLTQTVKTTKKGKRVEGKRNTYDYVSLAVLLAPLADFRSNVFVALERGQPNFQDTPKTAFSIAMGFGMWQLYFAATGISYDEYQPAVWKRRMGLWGTDKDASRVKAMHMFPTAGKFLCCKSDHDRAEALLLCEYARFMRTSEPVNG